MMFYQKGALLLLLTRSAISFTNTIQQNNAFICTNQAERLMSPLCTTFVTKKSKLLQNNALFSEESDESETPKIEAPYLSTLEAPEEPETVIAEEAPSDEPAAVETSEAADDSDELKIYVGNLSFDFTQEKIKDLFTPFGVVKDSFAPLDKWTGKPRGFGFVTMIGRENGLKAIEALHESDVDGRTINVNEQLSKEDLQNRPRKEKSSGDAATEGTRVYVGNLPFDCTQEELMSMFSEYGKVLQCFQPADRETGRPRGFAFIQMVDEEANAAIEGLNGSMFGGRQLTVNVSLPKGQSANRPKNTKMYVGNLSFNMEEEDVISVFSEYGVVQDCYLPRERETGRVRGFAFVTMEAEDALKAEAACDGLEMDGRVLRVNQAQAKPKPQRYNDDYSGGGGGGGGGGDFYDSY